ncbi:unnamed protein product [Bursaphelenchus okinawaensis]|uniref:Uncharacterized protein n=1 Tax=Bursaphelenchus okinawaensis TaxID=465554 RepID=A0A811KYM9_9BILA|nr:unnamed protein product [Bursaphelenchus okinawaensis]CAG9113994.1 unnamed protein product [Bursaphelenchus okinawaensis]
MFTNKPRLQLRVVKAFRSTLDEFDERRSTTSSQSFQSMRGLTGHLQRLSNGPTHLQDGLVGFNRRTSNIYIHTGGHKSVSKENSTGQQPPNGSTPKADSGYGENGRYGACPITQPPMSPTTATQNMVAYMPADKVEKIPLVQQWSPSSGARSSVSRHMGKSMSLDTPVSIAHV